MIVNFYLLLLFSAIPKKEKFNKHIKFREALYKAILTYITGTEAAGARKTLSVAGPVNAAPLPPGDSIPWVNQNAKNAATKNTAKTTYKTGKLLMATPVMKNEHQKGLLLKHSACVMCKQTAVEGKREVREPKSHILHTVSPFLNERYMNMGGESAFIRVFEPGTGPPRCYNCQGLGHKAFSCKDLQRCGKCAQIGHD